MRENRFFTRYRIQGEAMIQFGVHTIKTELVDFSFRGFGVYSPEPIDANISVKFFMSGKSFDKLLRGNGKVMYCQLYRGRNTELYRIGLEFIDVDSDQVNDLINVMRARESDKKV